MSSRILDRCTSTNDEAKKLAEQGAAHGEWLSARVQTRGRGRQNRKWTSLEGNLFLSMVVRPQEIAADFKELARWGRLPVVTALAVQRLAQKLGAGPERAKLKWPNDFMCKTAEGWAKCGGILCEGSGNAFVIVGIGLNCLRNPAEEGLMIDQPCVSLTEVLGHKLSADDVREKLVQELLTLWKELGAGRWGELKNEYLAASLLAPGVRVEWAKGQGTVKGIGDSGELVLTDGLGAERRLFSEEVRIRR